MDKFVVQGPCKLEGEITASGSKNAALPLVFATLLSDEAHSLSNVPMLNDMESALRMLLSFGGHVEQFRREQFGADWRVDTSDLTQFEAPYDLVRKMRASFFSLGPMLARAGRARVSLPGGCAIGARPVDLHLDALAAFGAKVEQEAGYVELSCPEGRLAGGSYTFPFVSVGATENALMAAVRSKGTCVIENAAKEPEVFYLGEALKSMGAQIEGLGTSRIEIQGVSTLGGLNYRVPSDRIEVGTYLIAGAIAGGQILVKKAPIRDLEILIDKLKEAGCEISIEGQDIRLVAPDQLKAVSLETQPFPGFATDLQAQWMALMTQAHGVSRIRETVFENRFMHVPEMQRLGANIKISGNTATVEGTPGKLKGAPVMATDLRASASLVLCALVCQGESHIKRVYHLDRGYESMELKLRHLGAQVERASE